MPDGGGEVWLQIGLQAVQATEQDIRPLNVALILDKSGSMADADKMSYLKGSLRIFLEEIANRGVTDLDQIAADSLAYNQQGIFLSTILRHSRPVCDTMVKGTTGNSDISGLLSAKWQQKHPVRL